jgi:hypothetical protein
MNAQNQNFFVIGSIENPDSPPLRQGASSAPEKIVFEFFRAGLFEAEDLATGGIGSGEDVLDGSILAGGVHTLENKEQRVTVVRIKKALIMIQTFYMFLENLFIVFFGFVIAGTFRAKLFEFDGCAFFDPEILDLDFELHG